MDTESTKQIIIAYYAIKNAIDAMLKPIRIEFGDAETMITMPKMQQITLEYLQIECEAIQDVLKRMDISALEKDLDADKELADAGDMIRDILFDIKPIPNQPALDTIANDFPPEEIKVGKTNLVEFATKVVMGK